MHRLLRSRFVLSIGVLALLAGPFAAARAMVIECGPTLCFEYDETQAAIGSLGAPVLVGDAMRFLPPALWLASAGGASVADASASFVFDRIYSPAGGEILALRALAEGDYEIIGSGTVASRIDLGVKSNLSAEEVAAAAVFSDAGDSSGALLWSRDVLASVAGAFAAPATDIRVTVGNLLQVSTAASSDLAWIQDKFLIVTAELGAPVPLPGALWLFVTAGAALGAFRVRRVAHTA
ncbi:MAG: hypothetical protein AMXMBFR8_19780 [Nevskiales bacterium]